MWTIHDTVFYTLSMLAKANLTKDSTDLFEMLHHSCITFIIAEHNKSINYTFY